MSAVHHISAEIADALVGQFFVCVGIAYYTPVCIDKVLIDILVCGKGSLAEVLQRSCIVGPYVKIVRVGKTIVFQAVPSIPMDVVVFLYVSTRYIERKY